MAQIDEPNQKPTESKGGERAAKNSWLPEPRISTLFGLMGGAAVALLSIGISWDVTKNRLASLEDSMEKASNKVAVANDKADAAIKNADSATRRAEQAEKDLKDSDDLIVKLQSQKGNIDAFLRQIAKVNEKKDVAALLGRFQAEKIMDLHRGDNMVGDKNANNNGILWSVRIVAPSYDYRCWVVASAYGYKGGAKGCVSQPIWIREYFEQQTKWGRPEFSVNADGQLVVSNRYWPDNGVTLHYNVFTPFDQE